MRRKNIFWLFGAWIFVFSFCSIGSVAAAVNVGSFTTVIHNASEATVTSVGAGTTVHDRAAVSGSAGTPTGTVDVTFYTSIDCTTGGSASGTGIALDSGGIAHPSSSQGPLNAGSYSFNAHYSGDGSYNPADSTCEPLTVTKIDVGTFTTVIHNISESVVTTVAQGTTVHDRAAVSGTAGTPTGTVTFTFFTAASNCTGASSGAGTVALDGSGIAHPSSGQVPPTAGSYSFQAHYNGDGNYNSADSACEPLTVVAATLTTSPTPPFAIVGVTTMNDKATLSGGFATPTGTITFTLFDPIDATCSGAGVYTDVVPVNGAADYRTTDLSGNNPGGFTPATPGTWRWTADYSGDANNGPLSSGCDVEQVTAATVVDTWSVNIAGNVTGAGYLTFFDNFTLAGYIIIKPTNPNPKATTTPATLNVGFFLIDGHWVQDGSNPNHRIGFFTGSSDETCGGTQVLNGNSFSLKVKTSKTGAKLSISMSAQTNDGLLQFTGIPPVVLTNFDSTSWSATVRKGANKFVELFDLQLSVLGLDNLYDVVNGIGAGYSITGCVLFSAAGKVAAEIVEIADSDGTTQATRNVKGTFNTTKNPDTATLTGNDSNKAIVSMKLTGNP